MVIADLLLIGVHNQALQRDLADHGYQCMSVPDIASVGMQDKLWSLTLVDQDLVKESAESVAERLYFLGNNAPVCVCAEGPLQIDPRILKVIHEGTLECLYYSEAGTGVLAHRMDKILLYHRLNSKLQVRQQDLREKEQLQRELTLRKHVADHERELNTNIIASISSGVLIIDLSGLIILMNNYARELLGIEAPDVVGIQCEACVPKQLDDVVRRFLTKARTLPEIHEVEKIRLGKGSHLQISGYKMLDSERRASGLLLFIQDISEQEEVAQQLYRSEKLATVGTMLSGISHELRNPLSIISARCQMSLRKSEDPARTKKALQSIEKQAERCAGIVNNLLDFTRQRATALVYHPVDEILDETLSYIEYQNVFDNITVEKDYPKGMPVFGDRSRYVQVFLNMISNAADAMGGRGVLKLIAREMDACVRVEINDSGPGIDESIRAKILDPFFTTKDPGFGTGLGLAIVNKIVTESSGRLWFTSQPGSTSFFVELPTTKG